MSRCFIGIDPGSKSGAIAWIDGDGRVDAAALADMTDHDLFGLLTEIRINAPDVVAHIEKVGARPGQGVSSTFKFGASFGSLKMALAAAGIPFEEVLPLKWQQQLGCKASKGCSYSERKHHLKAAAQRLFPNVDISSSTADALLIAEHCRRHWGA